MSYKQINRVIIHSYRDASLDTAVKITDTSIMKYALTNTALGDIIDKLTISIAFPPASNVASLVKPLYLLYTTLWNFTDSFIASSSVPKFTATMNDNSLLSCTDSAYRIADVNMFGLLCPLINGTTLVDLKAATLVLNRIQFPYEYGTGLPRSSISIVDADGNLRGFGYMNS